MLKFYLEKKGYKCSTNLGTSQPYYGAAGPKGWA